MPNWCITYITINHENEQKLKEFEEKLNSLMSKDYIENSFGKTWLGNLVGNSGIGTIDENKVSDLKCRGEITYMENLGNQLVIYTETAWVPMLKLWQKLLEKYLPDGELTYSAEECGCGIYCTNDPAMLDCYLVDIWEDVGIEGEYYCPGETEESVIEMLQKLLGSDEEEINVLLEKFENSEYTDKMLIRKWEYVDINEWD